MTRDRVTEKQLQDMAAHLSKVTGLDITKGGAYGGTCFQIGCGSENLTGYITKQACMDWAYAFLKGHALGQIKHKHDMIATAHEPNTKLQFVPGTVADLTCGDCGTQITTRYESSYEIGIAPFRWLCYACFHRHQEAPKCYTPESTCEAYAPEKSDYCHMPATHEAVTNISGAVVYFLCEKHSIGKGFEDYTIKDLRATAPA